MKQEKKWRSKEEYKDFIESSYDEILVYPKGHPSAGLEYTVKVVVLKDEVTPDRSKQAWTHVTTSGLNS